MPELVSGIAFWLNLPWEMKDFEQPASNPPLNPG